MSNNQEMSLQYTYLPKANTEETHSAWQVNTSRNGKKRAFYSIQTRILQARNKKWQ